MTGFASPSFESPKFAKSNKSIRQIKVTHRYVLDTGRAGSSGEFSVKRLSRVAEGCPGLCRPALEALLTVIVNTTTRTVHPYQNRLECNRFLGTEHGARTRAIEPLYCCYVSPQGDLRHLKSKMKSITFSFVIFRAFGEV